MLCDTDLQKTRSVPVPVPVFSFVSVEKQKGQFTNPANSWPPPTHPQPSMKPHYMTGKWWLCFSPSVDVREPSRSGTKVHFRDWSVVRCAYSEVPVAERDELSNAIARNIHHWIQGPRAGEESTDGGPLLRSPGSSDLIMWLDKSWRHQAERGQGSSWPPSRARREHSIIAEAQQQNSSYFAFVLTMWQYGLVTIKI